MRCPAPRADPPGHRRRAPGSVPRTSHPGRLRRRGSLQDPGGQRAAGEPRPAARRAGAAHTVQLPPRRRLGRAQAQGLRPRRDRPEGRRRDARGPLPVPGGAEGAPGPARRAAWQGQSQELDGPDRRVHARHHRSQRPLRRGGPGVLGAALPRGGPALVRRAGQRGPDVEPAPSLRRPALAQRRRGAGGARLLADPLPPGRTGARRAAGALGRVVPRAGPARGRAWPGRPQHARSARRCSI